MLDDAFSKGDLIRLTSFSIDKSWDSIVSPGPLPDQIHDLVVYAEKKGKLELLLNKAADMNDRADLTALVKELLSGALPPPPPQPAPPLEYQPTIPTPQGEEDVLKSNEAMLFANQDARLPFTFVQGAVRTAGSIARIAVPRILNGKPDGEHMFGTGWIIAPGLLITNHHVIDARDRRPTDNGTVEQHAAPADFRLQAEGAAAVFDYYAGDEPADNLPELRGGKLLAADETLDYAILEYADTQAVSDRAPLKVMQKAPTLARGARMNILQHPQGRWMRFAIRSNFFVRCGENPAFLRYQTDTEPGASGSPVCMDDWRVVGLHHASVKVPKEFAPQEWVEGLPKPVALLNEAVTLAAILEHLPADLRQRIADAQAAVP